MSLANSRFRRDCHSVDLLITLWLPSANYLDFKGIIGRDFLAIKFQHVTPLYLSVNGCTIDSL